VAAIRRSLAERVAARALTGFAGHLYGGVADWLEFLVRLQLERRRGRR
jgi:hypothetical protein